MIDLAISDSLVLARTANGQRAIVDGSPSLSAAEQRLLMLFNGYTPWSALRDRLPPDASTDALVETLLHQGLVQAVTAHDLAI